ncbi:unnamed protein product [Rotaria sordida]|uniref:RING-type domain-containing protein n=1 Tax=Rotaria sordida TaxID=392033 RepID=A0A813Q182_9BILA|nr:unnamed protein product [Rotaria sordida]CAF0729780.1 unnamed protein product [Rotaria sordida]CAF0759000.1 unnamed protein product [Rotaria sordida]CAF0760314.1 unnamed protein product [Rotaria sordida]CAF0820945.1 unnamed protein product [Rotaria sordida]
MGNCLRMPEDHSGLLDFPITPSSISTSSTISSSNSHSTVTHPISTISETHIPKLVILNRSSADLNTIKAAQCRNLVEHLPLISYDEKTIKQTECDICLMDFMPNEQVRQLPCDGEHVFHPTCIDNWFEKSLTCPHCSINVDAALLLRFIPKSNNNDDDD